jgi:hypothetical protein
MKAFYVDIVRDKKIGLLAGPFRSEKVARKYERAAINKAMDVDPWAGFDSFGVISLDAPDYRPPGRINHLIEIDPADLMKVVEKPKQQEAA